MFDSCKLWLWVPALSLPQALAFTTSVCPFVFSSRVPAVLEVRGEACCRPSLPLGTAVVILPGQPCVHWEVQDSPNHPSGWLHTVRLAKCWVTVTGFWDCTQLPGISLLHNVVLVWDVYCCSGIRSQSQEVTVTAASVDSRVKGRMQMAGSYKVERLRKESIHHHFLIKQEKDQIWKWFVFHLSISNNDSQHLSSNWHYVPVVVLSTSHIFTHLLLTWTLCRRRWGTDGSCDSEEVEPGSDSGHQVPEFVLLTLPWASWC